MSRTHTVFSLAILLSAGAAVVAAAPANRILSPVDSRRVRVLPGNVHRLANPKFDQGPVDPAQQLNYMMLMAKPSPAQQAELDQLLADQQNPSSPQFRKWLTPEEFAGRFGLSPNDRSKIVAWLQSEGFTIKETARGGNWIAFSGTAGQVSKSLHTSLHRFQVNGEKHFANTSQPSVPEALASVVGGFVGLHDFHPKSQARLIPKYNVGTTHYLTPADFKTIYNIGPLTTAGIDGTGMSIAVVGASDLQLSDLQAFKKRYGLPANDPKQVLSGGVDPGLDVNVLVEVDLDLEWASAIAPKATIYYVYGTDPIVAILTAVDGNTAPIISSSYAGCEIDYEPAVYQAAAQQGNAQGITIINASGDTGAAGCDPQGSAFATQGLGIQFPAAMPEVTAVGGTQFVEGTGSYWAATNTGTFGSALSYIPEAAWNESDATGLGSGGGGTSVIYSRPAWQNGPGVPNDNARHTPDVALSAAAHDGYEINYLGFNFPIAGTSAGAPSMAGIVALLNQYLMTNGVITKPGLGNINPQLYRLAQSTTSVFHDVVAGNNIVPCAQGSPDCLTGSFGFSAATGHDMATGLGSFDVNALATNWDSAANGVTVTLSTPAARVTANDSITLTATVVSAGGSGTPTGTVSFGFIVQSLGTATLAADGTASVTFPAYLLGTGQGTFYAQYSGDAAFGSGGATTKITITAPTGIASIIPSGPNVVWPNATPSSQGPGWQTSLTLQDVGGVASMLTGFSIDGAAQTVSQYFPQTNILPKGAITATFVLRNQATPLVHTYGFTGIDATGQSWSRQLSVSYYSKPQGPAFNSSLTATPLTVVQDTSADPSCQWPVQLHLDDLGGFSSVLTGAFTGAGFFSFGTDVSSQIVSTFGTTRVDAYGSISGTLCFGGITPPATELIEVDILNVPEYITVSFVGPPSNPTSLSVDQANITLAGSAATHWFDTTSQSTLSVGIADPNQQWTASVFPANRTTGWLQLSQTSGTGPGQITLTANGAGFEPAAYRATVVIQSPNAIPQTLSVPVMFVNTGSTTGTAITGVADPASGQTTGAPGMLLTVNGTGLANATVKAPARANPTPFSIGGVSATINGSAAPVVFASPNQLMVQIPYSTGAGPAVLSINNNGQVAGFQFQVAASAPGIYTDGNGNLSGTSSVKQGGNATLLINGAGDASFNIIDTAYLPTSSVAPILPVSVTVGGVPAFLRSVALASTVLGETIVSFIVPTSVPQGVQPVVVTVGGVASAPVNMTVQ